jgi:hypothetical protein
MKILDTVITCGYWEDVAVGNEIVLTRRTACGTL